MRFVINVLIALMLLGILTGVMMQRNANQQHKQLLADARADTHRLQREIMLQTSLRKVELSETGFPKTIDPAWFEEGAPLNDLISSAHPWVEIAHEDHQRLEHPPVKVALDRTVARFWYNPHNGRVRARVPAGTSDAAALRTYNFINDVNLSTLFEDDAISELLAK